MADAQPTQSVSGSTQPSIFATIRQEQYDFMFNYISIVPGYPFNQYQNIKRCHLYLNSKYEGSSTINGREKLFFNVVIPPCEVAMRMLNLDTKNIRLWPMNPKSYFSTYLLEKELKYWLKQHKLGRILNQLAEEAPRYGSVVLEKTADGAQAIDLRRLILDPTVDKITDSRFVTTISYMTPTQMRAAKGWDQEAVEQAIEKFSNKNAEEPYEDQYVNVNVMRSTPYVKVFKRYGERPAWELYPRLKPGTKAGNKMTKCVFIVVGPDWVQKNPDGKPISDEGVILFKSEWRKEWPFKDFHYMKTKGRWLGIGIVEMLFDVQVRINELKNQKRLSMELSSMHLFQSKDKSLVRNVLTDLQNGDLMISANGIEPIVNEERNLAAFDGEESSYLSQTDKLSFAYEAIRGDTSDTSKQTLGQTQIAVAQGTSVYAFKKENLALFLQGFFNDLVMPELMKDLSAEHIMRFTGTTQELQKMDEAAAEVYANDYVMGEILSGKPVMKEDFEAAKQTAILTYQKLGENRFLKMKDAFYDDAEFEFDFLITDEQADPQTLNNNIQGLIAEIAGIPWQQDPVLKLLVFKQAQNMGISQGELELADQQHQQMQQQAQAAGQPPINMGQVPSRPVQALPVTK